MVVMFLASENEATGGKLVCPRAKKDGPAEAHNVIHSQWFFEVCSRNFDRAYPERYKTHVYVTIAVLQALALCIRCWTLLCIAVHGR